MTRADIEIEYRDGSTLFESYDAGFPESDIDQLTERLKGIFLALTEPKLVRGQRNRRPAAAPF